MAGPTFARTEEIVRTALGYAAERIEPVLAALSFEPGEGLRALDATPVATPARPQVEAQVRDAHRWCAERFPLGIRDAEGRACRAVSAICVGQSRHPGEFLTASSPQRPGIVFAAAPWPVPSRYRLASLIAHEAMHQALYHRERQGPVARVGALGYSPWKEVLRPGRLVWHAFWTFSAQFLFLAEAVADPQLLAEDPDLTEFLAEMDARIECCAGSLVAFEILDRPETDRVERGLDLVASARTELAKIVPDYARRLARWAAKVEAELEAWAERQLDAPADVFSPA